MYSESTLFLSSTVVLLSRDCSLLMPSENKVALFVLSPTADPAIMVLAGAHGFFEEAMSDVVSFHSDS